MCCDQIKVMLNSDLFESLQFALAATSGQYRLLQTALRETRLAGYPVNCKLNGKIDELFDTAFLLTERWETITPQPATQEKQRSRKEALEAKKKEKRIADGAINLAKSLGYIWNHDTGCWMIKPEPPPADMEERAHFTYQHLTGKAEGETTSEIINMLGDIGFQWDGLNWVFMEPKTDDIDYTELSENEQIMWSAKHLIKYILGMSPTIYTKGSEVYSELEALGYKYYGNGQWLSSQQPTELEPIDWREIVAKPKD